MASFYGQSPASVRGRTDGDRVQRAPGGDRPAPRPDQPALVTASCAVPQAAGRAALGAGATLAVAGHAVEVVVVGRDPARACSPRLAAEASVTGGDRERTDVALEAGAGVDRIGRI